MSSNSWLGIGLSIAVGAIAGVLAPGAAFSWFYAIGAGALVASQFLLKPPVPANGQKPTDFGNSGRVTNTRDAAAEVLKINSATEAVTVPVVFGTCRVNANHIGYDEATFRTVPIIQRQERSPQVVAYRIAQETFESSPGVVNHEIDRAARKSGGSAGGKGAGKSGGKGGGGTAPPPSKSYSNADKINYYTSILLADNESGKSKLPREYDEFTSGYKYYLSFRMGLCMGEVNDLHAVLSYPGEKEIVSRREDSAIVADDTVVTAEGPQQGGPIRFYRGSAGQTNNVSDPLAQDFTNYRHTCFATFENYYMGNQPAPESFIFELTRIPVCLDADGDPVADLQTRAGTGTTPVAVTAAVWEGNSITVTAPGHGLAVGNTAFLAHFSPDGYNGVYVVTSVAGDDWVANLVTEPPTPTLFGKMQAPPVSGPGTPVESASWASGGAKLKVPDHGLAIDQLVELTGFTPSGWNGTWKTILLKDSDKFTLAMPTNPGAATVLGTFRRYPEAADITSANYADGKVTFESSGASDLADGDTVSVYGMEPPVYNGLYTVLEGDSGSFDVAFNSPPAPASKMGTVKGPATATPRAIGHVESWVGGVVTFDLAGSDPTGYTVGREVLVEGCTPAGYNGTYTVTKVNGDQFSAALATDPGPLTVAGTATLLPEALPIVAAAWEAGVVTFQAHRHGFLSGAIVTVAGMLPDGYNGVYTLTGVDGDNFSASLADDPGRVLTLGTSQLRPDVGYGDANPAAILYELITNKIWGRGLSPDLIDIPSFVRASQYYFEQGIGMSFSLESQGGLSDAIENLRSHVNLAVMWVGDRLYCQCLNDRATAYSPRIVITRDSVTDVEFSRDGWPQTFNEVRVGFMDRLNNFENALVTVQDDASINTLGHINSTKVDLPAVSGRDVATLIAQRILFESSYPQATLTFKMARFNSRLIPSSFVEFRWPDWSTGALTLYMRVVEIDDRDQDANGIQVTLVEDIWSTAILGTSDNFTAPVPAFEGMVRPSNTDVSLTTDKTTPADLSGLIMGFAEIPITLSDFTRQFPAFCQRTEDGKIAGVSYLWRVAESGGDFAVLGYIQPWAIAAVLTKDMAADGPGLTRDQPFEINLRSARERARLLEYCSILSSDSDSFEQMAAAQKNWLVIGNEFIQIAQAEAGNGANRVLVTAYMRGGNYGCEQVAHSAGDACFFMYDFVPYAFNMPWDAVPINTPLEIRAIPVDRSNRTGDAYTLDFTMEGLSLKPLRIQVLNCTDNEGDTWHFSYRPRFHNRGADIYPDFYESMNALCGEIPTGYELRVMPTTATGGLLLDEPELVDVTFTPDDPEGLDPTTGMGAFAYDPPADTAALLVYQVFNGILGLPARIRVIGSDDEDDGGGSEGGDPTVLRVSLLASTLSNTSQTGTEAWIDQDTTDTQANNLLLDWDYTTLDGQAKPTLASGKLSGAIGGFFGATSIAFDTLPVISFEVIMDMKVTSGTWVSPGSRTAPLFEISQDVPGGSFGGIQLELYEVTTTTAGLRVYHRDDATGTPTIVGPTVIALDTRQEIGFRATIIDAGSFELALVVDGSVIATGTVPFAMTAIAGMSLNLGFTSTLDFDPVVDFHGLQINSIP